MKQILHILFLIMITLSSCTTTKRIEPRRYQTLNQKATLTLQLNQQEYSVTCNVQVWRNEFIILSVQPILGIEVVRIEASMDSICIIDKMNRRYATIAFANIEQESISPKPNFKALQEILSSSTGPTMKAKSEKHFTFGPHQIRFAFTFTHREYNTLNQPKHLDLRKYKPLTLQDILPL